jgi:Flp pilus assembly pilin Flp
MQISHELQKAAAPAVETAAPSSTTGRPLRSRRKGRRGSTSMEYAVAASFILMVLIASVHALGFTVGGLMTSNAAATSKFSSGPKPGP